MWLEFDELDAAGWAQVVRESACPPIAEGPGRVVTATITHASEDVRSLTLSSGEKLGVTGNHRMYSATRQDWIAVKGLKPGEELSTPEGRSFVAGQSRQEGRYRVYNLEVEEEHCYHAGASQVLVHNACKTAEPTDSGGVNGDPVKGKMTREGRWQQLAGEGKLSKQETEHIRRHGGKGMQEKFGKELAHPPKQSNAQGHGYDNAVPKTTADHRGIQHRYLKERTTGTTISKPKRPQSPKAKLNLPPPGALP